MYVHIFVILTSINIGSEVTYLENLHCQYSIPMRSRVYTVRCPLLQFCCCGPGQQEISIDCCTAGAQQHRMVGTSTLSAYVWIWTQTCLSCNDWLWKISVEEAADQLQVVTACDSVVNELRLAGWKQPPGARGHPLQPRLLKRARPVLHSVYTPSQKKQDTKLLPITAPNVNRFSQFFHWHTHR